MPRKEDSEAEEGDIEEIEVEEVVMDDEEDDEDDEGNIDENYSEEGDEDDDDDDDGAHFEEKVNHHVVARRTRIASSEALPTRTTRSTPKSAAPPRAREDDEVPKEVSKEEEEEGEGEGEEEASGEEGEEEGEEEEEGEGEGEGEDAEEEEIIESPVKSAKSIKNQLAGEAELKKLGANPVKTTGRFVGVYKPSRPQVSDGSSRIPARLLNTELTCPICLSICRSTHTFMECLHRFCQGCIEKYLRLGQKECPKCRLKVSSRRALRQDPQFDTLIQSFYPDIDAFEEVEDEFISKVNEEAAHLSTALEEGLSRQANVGSASSAPAAAAAAAAAATSAPSSSGIGGSSGGAGGGGESSGVARGAASSTSTPGGGKGGGVVGTPLGTIQKVAKSGGDKEKVVKSSGAEAKPVKVKGTWGGARKRKEREGEEKIASSFEKPSKPEKTKAKAKASDRGEHGTAKSQTAKKARKTKESEAEKSAKKIAALLPVLARKSQSILQGAGGVKASMVGTSRPANLQSKRAQKERVCKAIPSHEWYNGAKSLAIQHNLPPPAEPRIFRERDGIIEFKLVPHPLELRCPKLRKENMCTVSTCTINVIQKFLSSRFFQANANAFDVMMNTKSQVDAVLPKDLTIYTVAKLFWSQDLEFVLMYRSTHNFVL